jgi:hypothetical protein
MTYSTNAKTLLAIRRSGADGAPGSWGAAELHPEMSNDTDSHRAARDQEWSIHVLRDDTVLVSVSSSTARPILTLILGGSLSESGGLCGCVRTGAALCTGRRTAPARSSLCVARAPTLLSPASTSTAPTKELPGRCWSCRRRATACLPACTTSRIGLFGAAPTAAPSGSRTVRGHPPRTPSQRRLA